VPPAGFLSLDSDFSPRLFEESINPRTGRDQAEYWQRQYLLIKRKRFTIQDRLANLTALLNSEKEIGGLNHVNRTIRQNTGKRWPI
jgi:hypothetical protein